jgi:TRAP-type C4-dicarboxylate transport system substrate-binding protein
MAKRFVFLVVVVSLLAGLLICSTSSASSKVLKISHQWAKGDIRDLWVRQWVDLATKKTGGQLKFEIYPAQSLFKAKAQFDAMRKGALDGCCLPFIYLSGKIPAYAITSMPCLVKTAKQGTAWGNNEIGKRLDEIGKKNGFATMSWGCIMGSIGSKNKAILKPSDLKGFKVRGAGKPMEEMLRAGGAAITSMPSTEIYFALQTGTLNALTTTYSSFLSFRLHEVLNFLTISKGYGIFYAHHGLLLANKTWDKLTADQQKALTQAGKETEPYMLKLADGILDKCAQTFGRANVKLPNLTEENYNKWLELAKKTSFKTYAAKVKNGQKLLDLALSVK